MTSPRPSSVRVAPSVAESLSSGGSRPTRAPSRTSPRSVTPGLEVENIIPEGFEGLPIGGYVTTAEGLEPDDKLVKFLRALAKGTYVALERPEIAELVTQEVAPDQWREPEVAAFLLEGLYETLAPYGGHVRRDQARPLARARRTC